MGSGTTGPSSPGMLFRLRLLLVEDDAVSASVVKALLRKSAFAEFEIEHVASLSGFAAKWDSHAFDLILLDLNLPDSEGLSTLEEVLAVVSNVPIVVLTGTQNELLGMTAVQQGAEDFLIKGEYSTSIFQRSIAHAVERFRLRRTLQQLAVMDELTGLLNRRGFFSAGGDFLQDQRLQKRALCLCAFDLDRFKPINDRFGHAMGDAALKGFTDSLRRTFDERDAVLGRIGGDEFLVLVPLSEQATRAKLQELEKALAQWSERHDGIDLATSCGIVDVQSSNLGLEELIAVADQNLYEEKHLHRKAWEADRVQSRS